MSEKNYYLEQASGFIKDRYPFVKELIFNFHYHDTDGLTEDSKKSFHMRPKRYAYFQFECPYWECVDGGFDLNQEVTEMLKNKKEEITGKKICMGWQDKERIGQHHCWCNLTYKIKAKYK